MNIKGVTNSILPVDIKARTEALAEVRRQTTQNAADRDADGKQQQQQQEAPNRHLRDEEFEEVLTKLKALPGIKDSSLTVKVVQHTDHRVIHIEDAEGQVVRRLSEADLWTLYFSNGRTTGQIFDKAA